MSQFVMVSQSRVQEESTVSPHEARNGSSCWFVNFDDPFARPDSTQKRHSWQHIDVLD